MGASAAAGGGWRPVPDTAAGCWLARLVGSPPAAASVRVAVEIAETPERERWTRSFGGRRLHHARPGVVEERFGPFSLDLVLRAAADGLRVDGWRIGRVPLPRCLAPGSEARETADVDGRFRFDVPIRLPLLGRLVRYSGWPVPEGTRAG